MKQLDRKGHVHMLTDVEIIERAKMCNQHQMCFISLEPLNDEDLHSHFMESVDMFVPVQARFIEDLLVRGIAEEAKNG